MGLRFDIFDKIPSDKYIYFVMGLLICQVSIRLIGFTPVEHIIAVAAGFCVSCSFSVLSILMLGDDCDRLDDDDLSVSIAGAFIGAILLF